ncbi:MAG: ADP-ribosylglycohydrolase family protein [Nitrospinota bacterium]|nr:ADP-ribosylglycohydrolase family protein [Nitrospinota bacterium]
MNNIQDKVVGSWLGMAVGDAMGSAIRGLKPATISQCFRQMDGFKDVRPFLGKGVKHYKMQGLYGSQTQRALVVCDTLLKKKTPDLNTLAEGFLQLAQGGPENHFGVYRQPEAEFRKAVDHLSSSPQEAGDNPIGGACLALAIPIALYYQKSGPRVRDHCLETCMMMSRNPQELEGTALTAFLINHFLTLEALPGAEPPTVLKDILRVAKEFCRETQAHLQNLLGKAANETGLGALGDVFQLLEEKGREHTLAEMLALICQNVSHHFKQPISHAAQGHVLTLLPLAMVVLVHSDSDFPPALASALNHGGQADKLGAITGALAGALYGFARIPQEWKAGLVNGKEIKNRGEALFNRQFSPGLKDLFEMESGLTFKEYENAKKYKKRPSLASRKTKSPARKIPVQDLETDLIGPAVSKKENPAQWRKYQKDKTRKKRDRRKSLDKFVFHEE